MGHANTLCVACLLLAGWLNLLGQIAAVSAVAFLCKDIIATMAMMASTVGGGEHLEFTPPQVCERVSK